MDAKPDRSADPPHASPPGPRAPSGRERIAEAVIAVLAEAGSARLTHRRVAEAAGVSVAATTYHYASKADMVADASQRLLAGYLESFRRAAQRQASGARRYPDLSALMAQVVVQATERHRQRSIAWCEIILDAARTSAGHELAYWWFTQFGEVWRELALAFGSPADAASTRTAVDTVVGLLFITLPLGLSTAEVGRVLRQGADPALTWRLQASTNSRRVPVEPRTPKAQQTLSRILQGAISILVDEGPGAISYRRVAEASGLTLTAPAYYFPAIDLLLRAAEAELFHASKLRYRESTDATKVQTSSAESLADLTTATFIREATEHGASSIALYSIWLEATRSRDLRPDIAMAVLDQAVAWRRRLAAFRTPSDLAGMGMQALFIGKLIRVVSSGAPLDLLAPVAGEFRHACSAEVCSTFFQK